MGILDIFFPKYCVSCRKIGDYLCDNCFSFLSFDTPARCVACNRASIDSLTHPGCKTPRMIDGVFSSLPYTPVVKKLVYVFKYKPYVTDLKTILGTLFYEGIIQYERFHQAVKTSPILIPIPLSAKKLRQRGYNHATLLAKELRFHSNLPVIEALERTKHTTSQFQLKREERLQNVANVFALQNNFIQKIKGKSVLLVDDVVTTGATLREAAKILKQKGATSVWGVTLARD